uniref:Peptidyl-prolyl cis-trans isomerase n=1 Tax=Oryza punctata TaxID=4537 RepID=A0A0E0LEJ1_ORYPU
MSVLIVTSVGDIEVDLHTDMCPLTTKNFLKLCKMKYYNGCLFHKVEKDFLAQTGDPTGTGAGGDSVYKFLYGDQARFFNDEIRPELRHSKKGTIAMASPGENCNASQFYITLRDDVDYLDDKHTVFGMVAEGFDTLTKISETYVDDKGRPFKDIRIKHTYVLDDPFDDPPQLSELIPENSPVGKPQDEIAEERLEDSWVPMDETVAPEELEEMIRSKEAHTNAVILQSVGDIPDAEIKPPDNVLFVCKLNPVTQDEDLYTIFSRFGTVTSAEIIRDYKTEFETKEACERAFFKMDNCLIDDRRIHVDFSQSVSKLWGQFRQSKRNANKDGCFKCGAPDHIAKECDQGTEQKNKGPSYVLKDENTQRAMILSLMKTVKIILISKILEVLTEERSKEQMIADQGCHLGVTMTGLAGRELTVMRMVEKVVKKVIGTEGFGSTRTTTVTINLVNGALVDTMIVATASTRAGANIGMAMMITDGNQEVAVDMAGISMKVNGATEKMMAMEGATVTRELKVITGKEAQILVSIEEKTVGTVRQATTGKEGREMIDRSLYHGSPLQVYNMCEPNTPLVCFSYTLRLFDTFYFQLGM